ncbi:MAG: hypothetical protein ABI867_36590 [Kofleriaceae bacterium]
MGSRVIAMAMAVATTGCSFLFVDGPSSSTPPAVYPSCDESRALPYVDAAIAIVYLVATAAAFSDSGSNDSTSEVAPGSLAAAAVFGTSAWFGFSRTGNCKDRRAQYRAQYGDPRAPQQPMIWAYPSPEGQACHPQAGCAPGLVCASGLCVRLPSQQPPPPLPPLPSPAPIQPGPVPQP